ncbi:MAG TPA: TfuA-like protein [Anaeromyxobacteraceae bacterium]|nr:TfuA-like protein [Anaeromyxobacteraceae bacterium]
MAPCRVLPPARAGDLFAVLTGRPLAIALVDGTFESTPSVWHHEILAALDAGVAVFGAASMGALRAAELWRHGMIGVGGIFAAYRDGARRDDADVALLHAGAEGGWRASTVPLVTAEAAIRAAAEAGVLSRREAGALTRAAVRVSWRERAWSRVLAEARLPPGAGARFLDFLPAAPDPKAADARACIAAAAEWAQARRAGAPPPPRPALRAEPSHVRRLRLAVARCGAAGEEAPRAGEVLAALAQQPDAGRLAADGLRRAVVAALARTLGLGATAAEAAAAERAWLARLGVGARDRATFLARCGLDDGAARRLAEDLAAEAHLLEDAARLLPDGPSWEEGLALAARLAGAWVAEVARARQAPKSRPAGARRRRSR